MHVHICGALGKVNSLVGNALGDLALVLRLAAQHVSMFICLLLFYVLLLFPRTASSLHMHCHVINRGYTGQRVFTRLKMAVFLGREDFGLSVRPSTQPPC